MLFELIAERYERKSLAITANTPFSQWGEVFVEPAMRLAAVDRRVGANRLRQGPRWTSHLPTGQACGQPLRVRDLNTSKLPSRGGYAVELR